MFATARVVDPNVKVHTLTFAPTQSQFSTLIFRFTQPSGYIEIDINNDKYTLVLGHQEIALFDVEDKLVYEQDPDDPDDPTKLIVAKEDVSFIHIWKMPAASYRSGCENESPRGKHIGYLQLETYPSSGKPLLVFKLALMYSLNKEQGFVYDKRVALVHGQSFVLDLHDMTEDEVDITVVARYEIEGQIVTDANYQVDKEPYFMVFKSDGTVMPSKNREAP